MDASTLLTRQGHRLVQTGASLFVFAALEGFVMPSLPVPRLGLSVHTLSALQGVKLLWFGLLWPRLRVSARNARIAFNGTDSLGTPASDFGRLSSHSVKAEKYRVQTKLPRPRPMHIPSLVALAAP